MMRQPDTDVSALHEVSLQYSAVDAGGRPNPSILISVNIAGTPRIP